MRNKKAYIWGLLARVLPSVIQLITMMILARYLSPSDFGKVGILAILFSVANILIDSGLGGSLLKEKDISKIDCSTIASFNIFVGFLFYLVLFFASDQVELWFGVDELSKIARLLGLSFLIGPLGMVPKTLLYRELKFERISTITILSIALAALFSVIFASLGAGVYALVALQVLNVLFSTVLFCIAYKYAPSIKFSSSSFKRLIPFGFFTTITSVIDTLYENILATLTGKYLGVKQAGYLAQSKKLEEAIGSAIAGTIGNITFPIITKLRYNIDDFVKEANSIYKTIILLVTPILCIVCIYSEEIMGLLFGVNWIPAASYLTLLTVAGVFIIIETLVRCFIKSLDKAKQLMKITIVKRVIGLAIIMLFMLNIPTYALWGYIVSAIIGFLINAILYCQLVSISPFKYIYNTLLLLLPSVIMGTILFFLSSKVNASLLAQIGLALIFVFIYYITVFPLFKVVTIKRMGELLRRVV